MRTNIRADLLEVNVEVKILENLHARFFFNPTSISTSQKIMKKADYINFQEKLRVAPPTDPSPQKSALVYFKIRQNGENRKSKNKYQNCSKNLFWVSQHAIGCLSVR